MATIDNWPECVAALCVWREARNQAYTAMIGVAWVIRNRVTARLDLAAVVTKRYQFSSLTAPGDPNLVDWPQMADASWEAACAAVDGVFGGVVADNTGGAIFYYSPPLSEPPVGWGPVVVTTKIGALTFCKPQPTSGAVLV